MNAINCFPYKFKKTRLNKLKNLNNLYKLEINSNMNNYLQDLQNY